MTDLTAELSYEPRGALTDENDGLFYLSMLLNECQNWLIEGGFLMLETGTCGLPKTPLHLEHMEYYSDLADLRRGGVYRLKTFTS